MVESPILFGGVFQPVECTLEIGGAWLACEVPTDMFARDTRAHRLSIEFVQIL